MILLNGKKINITMFPDNTSQVWKLDSEMLTQIVFDQAHITWDFEHEGELIHLVQLVQLLRDYTKTAYLMLTLNYLPYGRQDKDIGNNETFALHSFAHVINSLKFERIDIIDAHSSIATDLIINSNDIHPYTYINAALKKCKPHALVFPDAGASERYKDWGDGIPKIHATKTRDQSTGYITGNKLLGKPKGKDVLIIDDICDGGMTFILLAKSLYEAGATEVNLYVTHGIFSKGIEPLLDANIKRIFTKDGEVKTHESSTNSTV